MKAGQTHESATELRKELGRILDKRKLPPVHGGISGVVEGLRKGNDAMIDRLAGSTNVSLRHTALTAYMMESTWQQLGTSSMPSTNELCATYENELTLRHGQSLVHQRIAGLAKKTADAKLATLSAGEQIGSGMRGATDPTLELLDVLIDRTSESVMKDAEQGWQRTIEIAERSIPPMLASLSGSTAEVLKSLMMSCAQKSDRPVRKPSMKQDPNQYRIIRDHRGNEILTTLPEHAGRIPSVIVGPGCAAKYARDEEGTPISASVIQRILSEWKNAALQQVKKGIQCTSIHSLKQAHQSFLSKLREKIAA